jgi:uncharacterized protein (DUF1015 family)
MPIIEQKTPKSTCQIRDTNMEIRPFKALRFNAAVVGDVGECIAPPFDVISPSQQQQLYQRSRYNIVRITKGKTTPSDDDSNNQYSRAAEYFKRWVEEGALKQDPTEAVYAYVQDFELAGLTFQRLNFIALAKLEDFGPPGCVRPHEQILNEPLIDRLKLKRATEARFGLVFMLYEDQQKIAEKTIEKVATQVPLIDFVNDDDVRHRVYAITSKRDIDAIAAMMSDKSCIIADGHHRYTTGLYYSKECNNPAARYQMLAFANMCQDGLKVLATHRLVGNLENFDVDELIAGLKESFEVTELPFGSDTAKARARQKMRTMMKAEYDNDETAFGIYAGENRFYLAILKNKQAMDSAAPDKSTAWRSLDTAVLQKLVLEKLLGIDQEKLAKGENVEYVKDTPEAIDDAIGQAQSRQRDPASREPKQVLFFMNPVKMQQLKMVTDVGERMPPKSTYFFPKMYTGLTIQKL